MEGISCILTDRYSVIGILKKKFISISFDAALIKETVVGEVVDERLGYNNMSEDCSCNKNTASAK